MLAVGQSISIYKIKEILSVEDDHSCCFIDDPFFNRTILLKAYPIATLQNKHIGADFEAQFESLFLLEHRSIAQVYDSGFADDHFYFTTNYDYLAALQDSTIEEPSSEQILEWFREIATALAYAMERGFSHGHLSPDDLFVGSEGQVVIADFGVKYSLNYILDSSMPKWTEVEILDDLGRLQLQLLQPAGINITGREEELLAKIENSQIRQVIERSFSTTDKCYKTLVEMLSDINEIMKQPQEETIASAPKVEPPVVDETEMSIEERELVLPHVRELIAEKNKYQHSFDKVAAENNKLEGQLRQAYLALDEAVQIQLEVPKKGIGRGRLIVLLMFSFILGAVCVDTYRDNGSGGSKVVDVAVGEIAMPPIVTTSDMAEKKSKTVITVPLESAEIDEPAVNKKPILESEAIELIAKQSPLWLAVGNEFSVATPTPEVVTKDTELVIGESIAKLTKYENEVLMGKLADWVKSWSQQDANGYFNHYSDHYVPAAGNSRQEWVTRRTTRLQRPSWIKVKISDVHLSKLDKKLVQAKFQQEFQSNTYHDKINKLLNLSQEGGSWKIVTEKALGVVIE